MEMDQKEWSGLQMESWEPLAFQDSPLNIFLLPGPPKSLWL